MALKYLKLDLSYKCIKILKNNDMCKVWNIIQVKISYF